MAVQQRPLLSVVRAARVRGSRSARGCMTLLQQPELSDEALAHRRRPHLAVAPWGVHQELWTQLPRRHPQWARRVVRQRVAKANAASGAAPSISLGSNTATATTSGG